MPTVYRIRDWNTQYENDRSRTRDHCRWCAIPNKHGLGRKRLLRMENGAAMYGCFVGIVLLCSEQKKPRNGWLTRDGSETGTPLASVDIFELTDFDAKLIEDTIEAVSNENIGWIDKLTINPPPTHRPLTAYSPPAHPERKGKEGNGKENDGDQTDNEKNNLDSSPTAFFHKLVLCNYTGDQQVAMTMRLDKIPRLMDYKPEDQFVPQTFLYILEKIQPVQERHRNFNIYKFVQRAINKDYPIGSLAGAVHAMLNADPTKIEKPEAYFQALIDNELLAQKTFENVLWPVIKNESIKYP